MSAALLDVASGSKIDEVDYTARESGATASQLLARMVDIGFVVARHAGGTFRFVAEEHAPWESEVRLPVDAVLVEIDGLLEQWREIEVVIPSLECGTNV